MQVGPTDEVYWKPQNLQAARLFSDPPLNEIGFRIQGGHRLLSNGQPFPAKLKMPQLADGSYRLGFRADALEVSETGTLGASLPGAVELAEINGSETVVHIDVGFAKLVGLSFGVKDWTPGQKVNVKIDEAKLLTFDHAGQNVTGTTKTKKAEAF